MKDILPLCYFICNIIGIPEREEWEKKEEKRMFCLLKYSQLTLLGSSRCL